MYDKYVNPLNERYASKEMQYIFSHDNKFKTWRKLWYILAKSQKELGISVITDEMLEEMKNNIDNIDYELANEYEKKLKHDVMAHVHAFSSSLNSAKKIVHLGVTSAYVVDNTDVLQTKEALLLTKKRLLKVIKELRDFVDRYKEVVCLGYTHFQAAQPTTVGKRASLWLNSFVLDLEQLDFVLDNLRFRGVKGTTGTGASFKELFLGDYEKATELDNKVTKYAGMDKKQLVSGQTYDRKQDSRVLEFLSQIAQSAMKFTNDFRLLQHLKELEEPFSKDQIGSSAMAYKRNPMKCERVSSLSKFVIANSQNGAFVSGTQWLERTLDDSANKRLSLPQSFLAIDSILILIQNIVKDAVVYENMIRKNLMLELPYMITENILMEAVKKGKDRQEIHEVIRQLSMRATKEIKYEGKENHLITYILEDERIDISKKEMDDLLDPEKYCGFAVEQCIDYIKYVDDNILKKSEIDLNDEEVLI